MAKDNVIKVYRSTGTSRPQTFVASSANGPTFGEFAYVDGLTSLYIGTNNGGIVWVGTEVTGGDVAQGLEYAVPTMKAVKDYVTNTQSGYFIVRGEDGLTHQIDLAGTLTITGGTGIDVLRSSDVDTMIVTGLTATYTSWGVVKVNSIGPIIIDENGLNIGDDKKLFSVSDEKGTTEEIGYKQTLTLTGGRGIDVLRTDTDTFAFQGLTATTGTTMGVASFNSTNFSISNGVVSSSNIKIVTSDKTNLNSTLGSTLYITGSNGISTTVTVIPSEDPQISPDNAVVISAPTASTTVKGLASFNGSDFSVGGGTVSLLTTKDYLIVRDEVGATFGLRIGDTLQITGGRGIDVFKKSSSGEQTTDILGVEGATATTTTLGVASFNATHFSVSNGAVSLTGGKLFQVRDEKQTSVDIAFGDVLTLTGGPGINAFVDAGTDTIAIQGITATDSVLGVASFPASYFAITNGVVNLTGAYQVTGDTVTGPNAAVSVTKSGRLATIDARLADTSVTGVAYFDNKYFSVTTGLVKITSVDGGTF